jgi:hypothetical protein
MAIDMRYVYVNIYNKGMIPMILKKGPIFNVGMRHKFYERLKEMPGMVIYTVQEDIEMRARGIMPGGNQSAPAVSPAQNKYQPTPGNVPSHPGIAEKNQSSIDEEIARRAGELGEFDDENIKLNDSDIEEIKEYTTSRVYTREQLSEMSKSKLKYILNVERKNQPGSQYYGAFHDRKPRLIEYVLATQDQGEENK